MILKKIKFSQLWIDDIDKAHENFIQEVMSVIDNLALSKNKRIKGTSEDWFDDEILEKTNERDKIFKKSRLYVDEDNYKEARNKLQKLIRTKKKAYFESKLTQNIGKSKELWKSLKSLGLKIERSISNVNCLEMMNPLFFYVKDIHKVYTAYFYNVV